jgi:hypothetical protein
VNLSRAIVNKWREKIQLDIITTMSGSQKSNSTIEKVVVHFEDFDVLLRTHQQNLSQL